MGACGWGKILPSEGRYLFYGLSFVLCLIARCLLANMQTIPSDH